MKNEELELRRLIYGMTNVIIADPGEYKDILIQIEMIKSTMAIDGFIFKPDFADTEDLKAFTNEDWVAMFAQYSLTYGWKNTFESWLGQDPESVLQAYSANGNTSVKTNLKPSTKIPYAVEDTKYYDLILKNLAESKTVLREQQIRIINLMPIEVIEKIFKKTKEDNTFVIKETEILFIKRLVASGSSVFSFTDPDQVVRFVISNLRSNGEPVLGQINKNILKDIHIKIPTSLKKKILHDLNKISSNTLVKKMHKYKNFWKRLLKQLTWTSLEKMNKRYPNVVSAREKLYTKQYLAPNHAIETYKAKGDLESAFLSELNNPGQLLRNILQYLRYKEGDTFAKKTKVNSKNTPIMANMINKGSYKTTTVTNDVSSVLESDEFYTALQKTNTKLLWQVYALLGDKNLYEEKRRKIVNKTKIAYTIPLPGLYPDLASKTKKAIKKAIKKIKKEENKILGKVYIDPELKNYTMQFSGREDTSISLSGEYLPTGARINLDKLIKEDEKDDYILRVGLAWCGSSSCDIDLSMNVKDYGPVYYGRNLMEVGNKIIMSSSGDITSCNSNLFSTEFIDVDLKAFNEAGFSEMFNSAIMFSGKNFSDYECYWFLNVMKKKDRVSPGRRVHIELDAMHYATQITANTKAILGLYINTKKNIAEVINAEMKRGSNGMNASTAEALFQETLSQLPPRQTIEEGLRFSIKKSQIVDSIGEADLIISNAEPVPIAEFTDGPDEIAIEKDVKWLHPGRDIKEIQEIIF